jgi:hypothetical protein
MRGFLASTRRLAGKHGRRRVPRSLQGLPTPNIHRSWGNLKNLSQHEKEELLSGAWRASKPIQLVADKEDRDSGGFTSPVSFTSEEEALEFLAEEDADDAAELRESTLQLAQRFFADLATAADAEVDAGQMPPVPQSDEERRREILDVQRQFFADFYIEQGLITEAERYHFADAMSRPSRAFFLVNSTLPLVRLTLRDQLESHQHTGARCVELVTPAQPTSADDVNLAASLAATPSSSASLQSPLPIFATTDLDPCLYVVPLVPTQPVGAPLYVPFTAATTLIEAPESGAASAEAALEGKTHSIGVQALPTTTAPKTETINDADTLSAMLQDDFSSCETAVPASADTEVSVSDTASSSISPPQSVCRTAASPPTHALAARSFQPPNLAHMYWLQRQVASNTLLNVDLLSHAISLLSVHLAAATARERDYAVLLYQADTTVHRNARRGTACTYYTEIAQYLYRSTQEEAAEQHNTVAASGLSRVVVAVEDMTFMPSKSPVKDKRCTRRAHEGGLLPPPLSDASDVPVADRFPSTVYVVPPTQRQHQQLRHHSVGDNSTDSISLSRGRTAGPLRGRVVVCVPTTSQDGVRPRGWLSSGGDTEEDSINNIDHSSRSGNAEEMIACVLSAASPNNFVERCQLANANFKRLQRCLSNAIYAVDVDIDEGDARGGGWVIYATQSMNVMENEAVVCAVMQQIEREKRQLASTCNVSDTYGAFSRSLHVECVPMTSPGIEAHLSSDVVVESVRLLYKEGRTGLSTWVAIEGGSSEQDAEQYPQELRTAVAAASWRTDPMSHHDDGGYLICLRVTARGNTITSVAATTQDPSLTVVHAKPASSSLCWWSHPQTRTLSAVTPAAFHFLETITQPHAPERCRKGSLHRSCTVLHAGVPIGCVPSSAATQSEAAVKMLSTCSLSSAISHAEVMTRLKSVLPVLQISALALSELLVKKEVRSRSICKQLHLLEKQLPLPRGNDCVSTEEESVVQRESVGFFAAVAELILDHSNIAANAGNMQSSGRFHVVVEAAPLSFLPIAASHTDKFVAQELHPAVASELQAAGVVAELAYTQRTTRAASASVGAQPFSSYDFTLRLGVPLDMPERVKHLAAMEEWRVALRDALLYVSRRTGAVAVAAAQSVPRLWSSPSKPAIASASASAAAASAATGDADEFGVQLPRGEEGEVLELAEDEYEAAGDMPQHIQRPSGSWTTKSDTASNPMDLFAEAGGAQARVAQGQKDWLEGTRYREWRRRRSQS